jgi:hypothetical protein
MRRLPYLLPLALTVLAACGRPGLDPEWLASASAIDSGTPAIDAGLSDFCSGADPLIEVNGVSPAGVVVQGWIDTLTGYEAVEIALTATDGSGARLVFAWQHENDLSQAPPTSVDLSHISNGWTVHLYAGGSPSEGAVPNDTYDSRDSRFQGVLRVTGGPTGYGNSLCLGAFEDPAAPHPALHSARIWVPSADVAPVVPLVAISP